MLYKNVTDKKILCIIVKYFIEFHFLNELNSY